MADPYDCPGCCGGGGRFCCDCETVPAEWELTVSGLGGSLTCGLGSILDCSIFNGIWTLTNKGGCCWGADVAVEFCFATGGTWVTWHIGLVCQNPDHVWVLSFQRSPNPGDPSQACRYCLPCYSGIYGFGGTGTPAEPVIDFWDCVSDLPFVMIHGANGFGACGSSSEVSVVAVPL